MVTLLIATCLAMVTPLLLVLAVIWYGPENPAATFGTGRGAARIFNGGDAVLGAHATALSHHLGR